MRVMVAYATPDAQVELPVDVELNCTVALAIRRSGILLRFPEIDLASSSVGIFGRRVALDALLKPNDRIEIYRRLTVDPKQARRLRAEKIRRAGRR